MLRKRCIGRVVSTGRPAICSFRSSCPIRTEKTGSGNGITCTRPPIRWFELKCPTLVPSSPATSCVQCRACTGRGSATIRNSRRIKRWCSRASASGIRLFTWTRTPFASSTTTPKLRSIRSMGVSLFVFVRESFSRAFWPDLWLKSLPERRRRIGFSSSANATSFGSAASKADLPDGSCTLP